MAGGGGGAHIFEAGNALRHLEKTLGLEAEESPVKVTRMLVELMEPEAGPFAGKW